MLVDFIRVRHCHCHAAPRKRKRTKISQGINLEKAELTKNSKILHSAHFCPNGIMVADIEELGKLDASEIHARRPNAKEVLTSKKGVNISYSRSRMEQQNCVEEITKSENPL